MAKTINQAMVNYLFEDPFDRMLIKELDMIGKDLKHIATSANGDLRGIVGKMVKGICTASPFAYNSDLNVNLMVGRGESFVLKSLNGRITPFINNLVYYNYVSGVSSSNSIMETTFKTVGGNTVYISNTWFEMEPSLNLHVEKLKADVQFVYDYIRHDNGTLKEIVVYEKAYIPHQLNYFSRPIILPDDPVAFILNADMKRINQSIRDSNFHSQPDQHIFKVDGSHNPLKARNRMGEHFTYEYDNSNRMSKYISSPTPNRVLPTDGTLPDMDLTNQILGTIATQEVVVTSMTYNLAGELLTFSSPGHHVSLLRTNGGQTITVVYNNAIILTINY